MKRFYQTVEHRLEAGLYYFYLDNKIIKTPAGHILSTPSELKAQAVTAEWQNQTDNIIPQTMPVTKYLNSVHDKIMPNYNYIIQQLLDYIDSDCILFFTQTTNIHLYENQQKYWLPVIHYFETKYAVTLNYSTDFNIFKQPDEFKKQLNGFLKNLSYEDLTGLYTIITTLSSVLLGLYAYDKQIDYDTALVYSCLEEDDNIRQWGFDADIQAKRQSISQDYAQAVAFLKDTLI